MRKEKVALSFDDAIDFEFLEGQVAAELLDLGTLRVLELLHALRDPRDEVEAAAVEPALELAAALGDVHDVRRVPGGGVEQVGHPEGRDGPALPRHADGAVVEAGRDARGVCAHRGREDGVEVRPARRDLEAGVLAQLPLDEGVRVHEVHAPRDAIPVGRATQRDLRGARDALAEADGRAVRPEPHLLHEVRVEHRREPAEVEQQKVAVSS